MMWISTSRQPIMLWWSIRMWGGCGHGLLDFRATIEALLDPTGVGYVRI